MLREVSIRTGSSTLNAPSCKISNDGNSSNTQEDVDNMKEIKD
jgi:hypothetical protein